MVTDGSPSYRAAIHRYLPTARHVLDRFHAVRWFAQGLTLVRRELQRRQPPGVKPAFEPDLFRARFCLLRRNDHLTTADRKRLERLFDAHPRSGGLGRFARALRRETPPVVARLSQNCWLSNTSENHPVEVFNYGSEAFFR